VLKGGNGNQICKLKKLEFTENIAKSYAGFLSLNETTAKEIHEFTQCQD